MDWTIELSPTAVITRPSRHWDSSTVIIDYDNWKVLKDGTGGDPVTVQGMLDHVQKHYPQQFQKFMDIVRDVIPKKE